MREADQRLTSSVSVSASQVCGLTLLNLAVSISEAPIAQLASPFVAAGDRMARSTALVSISTRP
jgi:hypothetical protein